MSNVKIMNYNYLDSDIISAYYQSSEQTAFPATNLYNAARRSKVWRSNGYWEITASNNVIIFQETTSVNLTATVAAANYTSTTTFLAAIKTALEAAGDSTYTVAQDTTTGKIKITSNGAGGGNIFSLMWSHASTTMESVLGFSNASDDTGALTYTADVLKIHTSEWLKWDLGISSNPKSFVMIGQRNSAIKITPSATLTLQGNETDAWTTPSYSQTLTYNDATIALHSSTGLHTEALRYWRLLISDQSNANLYVEIGAIYLGDVFEPTYGAVQFPFNGTYKDLSTTSYSEGGQSFSDVLEQTEEFSVDWFGLIKTEKETIDSHFADVGTHYPFFIALDPNNAISSINDYYTRYVKYASDPLYSLESPGIFSMSMSLREEL